ncbi:MAG: 3-oxoacyl-[acyl-carrier-protein] reductase [Candidatus Promineifilaceae bacterium]
MLPPLNHKVAVVTGASRGIGRAIALDLAENGAQVVVNFRQDAKAAAEVVNLITSAGGAAVAVQADVSQTDAAQALVKQAMAEFGRIDILVNNAGTTHDALVMRMKETDWDRIIDINLKSVFNCSKAVLRPMLRGKRGGRIINISSVAGLVGNSGQASYAAAKAGIHGFTKSFAKEIGSRGITVNAVAPGLFLTDLTATLPTTTLDQVKEVTPIGRLGSLPEVAYLVSFLASDKAAYITGEVIRVDGGLGIG